MRKAACEGVVDQIAPTFLARIGPLTSSRARPPGNGSPFWSISTSPCSRISHRIWRTSGMRSRQVRAPVAFSSDAVKARGTSEGHIVLGYSLDESKRLICGTNTSWRLIFGAIQSLRRCDWFFVSWYPIGWHWFRLFRGTNICAHGRHFLLFLSSCLEYEET